MILMNWLEVRYLIYSHAIEIMLAAFALIFTALGIWLASRLMKPKVKTVVLEREVIVEKGPEFKFNEEAFQALNISDRELEVLREIALGLSNQEIADKLNLSLPTIKTHASNLFGKMDVKRRTQAIEKAKSLNLIP